MNKSCTELIVDHRRCDDLFLQLEDVVSHSAWDRALPALVAFSSAFRQHVSAEESTFFPLLRKAAGDNAWPITVLHGEHAKLELILRRIETAVQDRNREDFMMHAESFFILMHTHSIKEEEILYPRLE